MLANTLLYVPVPHVSTLLPAVTLIKPDAADNVIAVLLPNVDVTLIVVESTIELIQYCWLIWMPPSEPPNTTLMPTYIPAEVPTVMFPPTAVAVAVVVTIPAIDAMISSIVVVI